MYNWEMALSACPSGWHLPSDEEWTTLTSFAGCEEAGKHLKATSGWDDYQGKSGNGLDTYGFAALPNGQMNLNPGFGRSLQRDSTGMWWTATERDPEYAYFRTMGRAYDYVYDGWFVDYKGENARGAGSKTGLGISVRCIKD
jgi:uncharacterized protein (TIGR02145 family)